MTQVRVRECREGDVALLEEHIPSPGLNRFHEARFQRQRDGLSTFLVAVINDTPVGSGEILWQGCGASTSASDISCHYLDRYPYLDEQGTPQTAADPCRFLVKTLSATVADPM